MHQALAVILLLVALSALARTVQRARAGGGGGGKPAAKRKDGLLSHRRRLREMREKGRLEAERDDRRHRQRLAEQATRAASGARGAASGAARTITGRVVRLRPERPGDEDGPQDAPPRQGPPPGSARPAPAASARPPAAAPGPPAPPPPRSQPQSPPAPAPAPASEGTTTVTSPAIAVTAVEDVLLGIDRSADTGIAGNVHAKRRALAEIAAVLARCDSAITRMQKAMTEEGLYGAEITDPMTGPADMAASAARDLGEVDSVIRGLLKIPAGELAGSGYRVPHHAELSETGAR